MERFMFGLITLLSITGVVGFVAFAIMSILHNWPMSLLYCLVAAVLVVACYGIGFCMEKISKAMSGDTE